MKCKKEGCSIKTVSDFCPKHTERKSFSSEVPDVDGECLALGCVKKVPPVAVCCPKHWSLLPTKMQDEILASPHSNILLTEAQLVMAEKEGKLISVAYLKGVLASGNVL